MKSFLQDLHNLIQQAPSDEREYHRIFFDHLIDLTKLSAEGDVPAQAMLRTFENSEPLQALLDFDQVKPYLASLGFGIHQQLCPPEMYAPYQTAANQDICLKPSKYFGIVVATDADS